MPDIKSGRKPFEIRLDDRHYEEGDNLILQGWDTESKAFTGQEITVEVGYILKGGQFGIEKGFVIMGIKLINSNY